jgi:uncharacterized DUF497 family protein
MAEKSEEVERKLWGKVSVERPRRIVQLEGLWEDVSFDVTIEDIRQVRRELSEALGRYIEGLMHIDDIIWLPQVIDKLAWKHHVAAEEVDEVLFGDTMYRRVQRGHVPGEDLYSALGQTHAGRYLIVFFIYKSTREALVLSARDMDAKERRQYGQR